jgi:spermidine/putrescine transport system substrate-binding protein
MMVLVVALALLATGVFAQDSADSFDPSNITWTCPEGYEGQTLNIYNWATYIGNETVRTFEELCGVTVVYDVYDSNESMVARLRQSNPGYDIAVPSDYIIPVMINEELIVPLDKDMIPNLANISERWLNPPYDPEDAYTAAYMWGSTGIAYNVNKVSEPLDTWEEFFNHAGPVAWLDDPRSMLSFALDYLGYGPNSVDADEITAARDFLLEHSANVLTIAADDGQALLERGEVDAVIEFGGDIYQLLLDCECEDYAYVLPESGFILDVAGMVVLADGPNPELAHVFIDFVLDPYVNAWIVNDIAYPTANQAAIDSGVIAAELTENPQVFPDVDNPEAWFLEDIGDADVLYNDAWDELRILIGR